MMEQTVNANINTCMKSVNGFGETIYHNVCNGSVQTVPWGGLDWVIAGLLISLCLVFIAGMGAMAVSMWRDF